MKPYELTLAAEDDLRGIWQYTDDTWGLDQAETYFDKIEACCDAVGDKRARSKTMIGLPDGVRIHCCEHHYIIWLDTDRPLIIAILHERMDFMQRLIDRL